MGTPVQIGNYTLLTTLGIGAFGKVKREFPTEPLCSEWMPVGFMAKLSNKHSSRTNSTYSK